MALSADASDPEIYFINGVFHDLAGDLPRALAAYEASLRRQPRDRRMLDLLVNTYARAGRFKEAVDMSVRRAEIDPGDFYANVRAARALRSLARRNRQSGRIRRPIPEARDPRGGGRPSILWRLAERASGVHELAGG